MNRRLKRRKLPKLPKKRQISKSSVVYGSSNKSEERKLRKSLRRILSARPSNKHNKSNKPKH